MEKENWNQTLYHTPEQMHRKERKTGRERDRERKKEVRTYSYQRKDE